MAVTCKGRASDAPGRCRVHTQPKVNGMHIASKEILVKPREWVVYDEYLPGLPAIRRRHRSAARFGAGGSAVPGAVLAGFTVQSPAAQDGCRLRGICTHAID